MPLKKKKTTAKAKSTKKSSAKSNQAEAKKLLAKMKAKEASGDCAFC